MTHLKDSVSLVAYKTGLAGGTGRGGAGIVTIGWMTLVALAIVIGWLVTFTLLKMADDNDRAARHAERELIPFSDVTVTQAGYPE